MSDDNEDHNVLWTKKVLRDSPAFRSLNGTAILVYMDFHSKKHMKKNKNSRKRTHSFLNNGELVYTYKEAESRGISRSTFMRALNNLIETGFIDVKFTGAGRYRSESLYALSNRWRLWGTSAFVTAKRNPHGRNKKYGFQPGHTQRNTDGKLKNVAKNDNEVYGQNDHMLIENDNGYVEAVVANENDPLPKTITGQNSMHGSR